MSEPIKNIDNITASLEDSSLVSSLEWKRTGNGNDPKGILSITFKSNQKVYEYTGVKSSIFNEMLMTESVGKYFHKNIKDQYDTYIIE